jgi:hypothetical protein
MHPCYGVSLIKLTECSFTRDQRNACMIWQWIQVGMCDRSPIYYTSASTGLRPTRFSALVLLGANMPGCMVALTALGGP